MKPVVVHYAVALLCNSAQGLYRNDYIGRQWNLNVEAATDTRTLLTGSGNMTVTGTLTRNLAPDGENETEPWTFGPVPCVVTAGRLDLTVPINAGAATVALTVYLTEDGLRLDHGHFDCTIRKWTWRLLLRGVSGKFSGKMLKQEFQ